MIVESHPEECKHKRQKEISLIHRSFHKESLRQHERSSTLEALGPGSETFTRRDF